MALTEQEQHIVDKSKAWYFGAFLGACWFQYPDLLKEVGVGDFPETETLQSLNKRIIEFRFDFDFIYLIDLPEEEINPLKIEQEAWKLLSPHIKKHETEFGDYMKDYSQQNVNQEQLLTHINTGWNLLQKWNVISNSYRAKYCQNWDVVCEREEAVKKLIQELQQIPPTEPR